MIECQRIQYDKVVETWIEVQYLSSKRKWIFFGDRYWVTYTHSIGDKVFEPIKFVDISAAKQFITEQEIKLDSPKIIRKELCMILGAMR